MCALSFTTTPHRTARGRRSKRPDLTAHEAKSQATLLVTRGMISPTLLKVVDALAVGGVLTSGQLRRITTVSTRSLQRYQYRHLVDRLYLMPTVLEQLNLAAAPIDRRLYTLGIVGQELARHNYAFIASGYTGYGIHRIVHDVLCNEVVIRLALTAAAQGDEPIWASKYEATVPDESGRPVVEPDAMLILKGQQPEVRYLVEYHNEDHQGRAEEKVRRYEAMVRDGHWQRTWATEEMPVVLVVWTHKAVGTGYREAIAAAKSRGLRCTYLGKPWQAVMGDEHPWQWFNFNTGHMVELLKGDR